MEICDIIFHVFFHKLKLSLGPRPLLLLEPAMSSENLVLLWLSLSYSESNFVLYELYLPSNFLFLGTKTNKISHKFLFFSTFQLPSLQVIDCIDILDVKHFLIILVDAF